MINLDNKTLKKLNIKIPPKDIYKSLYKGEQPMTKIKTLYGLTGMKFFITDQNDNLIFKVKTNNFVLGENYTISTPYNKKKGKITFIGKKNNLNKYRIILNKKGPYEITAYTTQDSIVYKFDTLPIEIKGQIFGGFFQAYDINKSNTEIANIEYISKGKYKSKYELKFNDTEYKYEIMLAIICTKLMQINKIK